MQFHNCEGSPGVREVLRWQWEGFVEKVPTSACTMLNLAGQCAVLQVIYASNECTSSSRMRVIYHNWSATKQRPHLQSVAEIRRHSVLSGDRIRQFETSSGSRHKDTDQCL